MQHQDGVKKTDHPLGLGWLNLETSCFQVTFWSPKRSKITTFPGRVAKMSLCNIFLATGVEFITKDPLLKTYLGRSCRFHRNLNSWHMTWQKNLCCAEAWRYAWNCFVLFWQLTEVTIFGSEFTAWKFARKLCTKITKVCGLSGRTLLTLISFIHADSINTVQLGIDRHGCLLMLKHISCQYSDIL